jgi:hypothetical protein
VVVTAEELPEFMSEATTIVSDLQTGGIRYPDAVDKLRSLAEKTILAALKRGETTRDVKSRSKVDALRKHFGHPDDPTDVFKAILDCPYSHPCHYQADGCPACASAKPDEGSSGTPAGV